MKATQTHSTKQKKAFPGAGESLAAAPPSRWRLPGIGGCVVPRFLGGGTEIVLDILGGQRGCLGKGQAGGERQLFLFFGSVLFLALGLRFGVCTKAAMACGRWRWRANRVRCLRLAAHPCGPASPLLRLVVTNLRPLYRGASGLTKTVLPHLGPSANFRVRFWRVHAVGVRNAIYPPTLAPHPIYSLLAFEFFFHCSRTVSGAVCSSNRGNRTSAIFAA